MKSKKNAESLIGIVIAIFILSFTLLGILSILDFNNKTNFDYSKEIDIHLLNSNSENILKKLDLSSLNDSETFYIYKDSTNSEYQIFTGAVNEEYMYINSLGEKIDPSLSLNKKYTREFTKNQEILNNYITNTDSNNYIPAEKEIKIYNY